MPSCLVIQHVEPERPYAIGKALSECGVDLVVCRVFAHDPLPERLDHVAGLVVMGGPMSAASDDGFPTRAGEIDLLEQALERGLPTLGVCLGAQLLAVAAGEGASGGTAGMEVGWGPVRLTTHAGTDPLLHGLPGTLRVLHWHGDTFTLPAAGYRLASSRRYREQAFRVGERAWGFQFHLEVDRAAVVAFLDSFGLDALAAGTSPEVIWADTPDALRQLVPYRSRVLLRFARLVAAHGQRQKANIGLAGKPG